MDFIIFLILAGVALAFRWLTNQASDDTEQSSGPRPNEPSPRSPTESEEERVRKFLEALGVPPGTRPPPPLRPRSVKPRRVVTTAQPPPAPRKVRRTIIQPLPPLVTTPEDFPSPPPLTSKGATPPPVPQAVMARAGAPSEETASSPLLPILQLAPTPEPGPSQVLAPVDSLGGFLRSRDSLRQAIILREVLGPPRGLQSLEQV